MIRNTSLKGTEIFSLIALYFAALVPLSDQLNAIALYAVIPVVFLLSLFRCKFTFPNQYVKILFILYIWIAFTSLFALNTEHATRELRACIGAFIFSYSLGCMAKKKAMVPWLYITFIVLFFGVVKYARENILPEISLGEDRLNDEKLNANTLAYYTFYLTFVIYLLGDLFKRYGKIYRLLFFLTIPLSFYIAILTASRQVLIIQIPFITALLFTRYFKWSFKSVTLIFLFCVVGAGYIHMVSDTYNNSLLATRSEVEATEDIRFLLLAEGTRVGLEHPLVGVGPGNFVDYNQISKHFSHCSYIELFANTGILGVFIFTYMFVLFAKRQWTRYKSTKDKNYMIFFIFAIVFILDNIFYVFYHNLWLISFFILVASHSETYYKEQCYQMEPHYFKNL